MVDEPIPILIAALICWLNFMTVDLIFKLPHSGGVSGATAIAQEVEKGGGKLAAAAFYSVYIVIGARALGHVDALASTTVVCLSAAATLALSALFTQPRFPGAAWGWAAIGAIAVLSTVVAILAFFAGLKRVGPAVASIVSTLEPVVTVALAWLVLGESLTALQLAGGAVVLACAALLARGKNRG